MFFFLFAKHRCDRREKHDDEPQKTFLYECITEWTARCDAQANTIAALTAQLSWEEEWFNELGDDCVEDGVGAAGVSPDDGLIRLHVVQKQL